MKDSTLKPLVTKLLIEIVDGCYDYIRERVIKTDTYREIERIPKDGLPLHLNDYEDGTAAKYIFSCRMTGEDPLSEENLPKSLQLLYDQEFNIDTYRNIGVNDGQLAAVSFLARKLGDDVLAEKAGAIIYKDD